MSLGTDLGPLFETIISTIPAPLGDPDGGFQLLVANIYYDDYVGRSAVGRIARGRVHPTGRARPDRPRRQGHPPAKPGQVLAFEGLKRVPLEEGRAGDVVVLTGLEGIEIGDTISSPDPPEALPRIEIEEPTVKIVARREHLAIRRPRGQVLDDPPDPRPPLPRARDEHRPAGRGHRHAGRLLVSGRGELHLAILLETLRREGYEFEVSRPEVITKMIDGQRDGADREPDRRDDRAVRRRGHREPRPPARPDDQPAQRRQWHRPDRVPDPDARADRLPQHVPHADPRRGADEQRDGRLRAVVRRAAAPADGRDHRDR